MSKSSRQQEDSTVKINVTMQFEVEVVELEGEPLTKEEVQQLVSFAVDGYTHNWQEPIVSMKVTLARVGETNHWMRNSDRDASSSTFLKSAVYQITDTLYSAVPVED